MTTDRLEVITHFDDVVSTMQLVYCRSAQPSLRKSKFSKSSACIVLTGLLASCSVDKPGRRGDLGEQLFERIIGLTMKGGDVSSTAGGPGSKGDSHPINFNHLFSL